MHSSEKSKESFYYPNQQEYLDVPIELVRCRTKWEEMRQHFGFRRADGKLFRSRCRGEVAVDWFLVTNGKSQPAKRTEAAPMSNPKTDDEGENKPLTFALNGIDHAHQYLHQRGVKEIFARDFGIGFFPGKGSDERKGGHPDSQRKGESSSRIAGRAIDQTEPKYKLPAGFKKSAALF